MQEQFVTYEIALALKELGFDEPCLGLYYTENNNFLKTNYSHSNIVKSNDFIIDCPLWQQVIDWFREKYELHITITSQSQESWQWHIQFPHDSLNKLWEEDFENFEEVREQAILKAIELCKNN